MPRGTERRCEIFGGDILRILCRLNWLRSENEHSLKNPKGGSTPKSFQVRSDEIGGIEYRV